MIDKRKITLALPKGRILEEALPLLARAGISPEPAFFDERSRKLRFTTNHPVLEIIRVRAFDVATIVAFGAAEMGIAGLDVIAEFDYPEVYAPVDLGIGRCRLSLAQPQAACGRDEEVSSSHLRVATKYPRLTAGYFAARGIQAECIRLSGAVELAPSLGLTTRIVDLVSSGRTLAANGLAETAVILEVTARLIVNRAAFKTRSAELLPWIRRIAEAVEEGRPAREE
ncbi:MAG: ATP phosphoribosyltransferase [Alphaproteobacteria bacterium]|nr:MAG: ATP phosphoribosyltransferase [Alphaproteobacteria bacterium]